MTKDEMHKIEIVPIKSGGLAGAAWVRMRETVEKFVGLPLLIVLVLICITIIGYGLDRFEPLSIQPLQQIVGHAVLKTSVTALSVIGGGLLTVTSVVISMLLLSLQQPVGQMGSPVVHQLLISRRNHEEGG